MRIEIAAFSPDWLLLKSQTPIKKKGGKSYFAYLLKVKVVVSMAWNDEPFRFFWATCSALRLSPFSLFQANFGHSIVGRLFSRCFFLPVYIDNTEI